MELSIVLAIGFLFLLAFRPLWADDPRTMATAANMLREDFLPDMRKAIDMGTPHMARLNRRTPELVGGKYAVMVIESQPNESFGGRSESETLPYASHASEDQGLLYIGHHYASIAITGPAIAAALRNPEKTINELDKQTRAAKETFRKNLNMLIYRDGSSRLAKCVSASDAGGKTTIVCNAQINEDGANLFRVKMPVAVLVKATGATTDGVVFARVDSVDADSYTVTLDRVVGTAANIDNTYGIYFAGSWDRVMYGMAAMVSDVNPGTGLDPNGRYGAIDRSAETWWQAPVIDNGGSVQPLTWDLIAQGIEEGEKEGGKISALYMRPPLWRAVGNLLFPQREWAGQTKKIDAGYSAFFWDGRPFIADWDALPDQIVLEDESTFNILENEALGVLDVDGLGFRMSTDRKDLWIADLVYRLQVECKKCNANSRITHIQAREIPTQAGA
ncbi:MAG: phage major capsid protein [Phycisphaerae bacterium]|nr:phage major capsid protein [Phycisphaerae bacterium]